MHPNKSKRIIRDHPWLWAIIARGQKDLVWRSALLEIQARVLKPTDLATLIENSLGNNKTRMVWIYSSFNGHYEYVERMSTELDWRGTVAEAVKRSIGEHKLADPTGPQKLNDTKIIDRLVIYETEVQIGGDDETITIYRPPTGTTINRMIRESCAQTS